MGRGVRVWQPKVTGRGDFRRKPRFLTDLPLEFPGEDVEGAQIVAEK